MCFNRGENFFTQCVDNARDRLPIKVKPEVSGRTRRDGAAPHVPCKV